MSELVMDGATVVLAAATAWLAWVTSRTVRAALIERIDAASPSTVVLNWRILGAIPASQVTKAADPMAPGLEWNMGQQGATRVGLAALGTVTNESPITARFKLEAATGVDVDGAQTTGGVIGVPLPEQGGWWLLGPGENAHFHVTWWRPAAEWHAPEGTTPEQPDTKTIRLISTGTVARAATDTTELEFGAFAFVHPVGQSIWVSADFNSLTKNLALDPPCPPVATIDLTHRAYSVKAAAKDRPAARKSARRLRPGKRADRTRL